MGRLIKSATSTLVDTLYISSFSSDFVLSFQTFDLKGSMRSRYVQTSEMKNDVLLDENLLESK